MARTRAVIALAAAWLAIAADVLYGGPISHADVWLADRVALMPYTRLAFDLQFWTNLHSQVALLVYSAIFVLLLARRRAWGWAAGVALAVPGTMVLNAALKHLVQRSRPVLDNPILALNTSSFPSGHTAAATAFYGMLAAYLAFRYPRFRRLWGAAAVLLVLLVAYSRMALGVHYFGDVLGALASSGAWLVVCLGGVHAWHAARPR
jgi:undecaprenyl-diphosphatase